MDSTSTNPLAHPPSLDGKSDSIFEANPVGAFMIDLNHVVTQFNAAGALTLGISANQVVGKKWFGNFLYGHDRPMMADLIVDGKMKEVADDLYQSEYRGSLLVPDAYESEGFFKQLGASGRWLFSTAAPIRDANGKIIGAIQTLQDQTEKRVADDALMKSQVEIEQIVEQRTAELAEVNKTLRDDVSRREVAEHELISRNAELSALNAKLSSAQEHLIQSEKLASIGQLAAGVAHEINNPIGYIFSNFGTLENYLGSLFEMLTAYENTESVHSAPEVVKELKSKREGLDLKFLKEDIPVLMRESKEGIVRVRKIVQDLKDFSHVDNNPEWQHVNLNSGIESTLNVINNELKYKADVIREYGDIPDIQCLPSQVNQVVMNLVVNAAHAMGTERGKITVRTGVENENVWFNVTDTGSGIPADVLPRIFDPFYTTKPIGKGTGLGLSLSYGIIQKHHGTMTVHTEVGKGSTFRVTLPIQQSAMPGVNDGASHS